MRLSFSLLTDFVVAINRAHLGSGTICLQIVLDSVKGFLEEPEHGVDNLLQSMKTLRLVNRHWSRWATTATTMLKPRGQHIKLEKLVEVISQQFVNLNTLHLDRMENFTDDGLCSLSMLPNLTNLSLMENWKVTDAGCEPFGDVAMPKRDQSEMLLGFD